VRVTVSSSFKLGGRFAIFGLVLGFESGFESDTELELGLKLLGFGGGGGGGCGTPWLPKLPLDVEVRLVVSGGGPEGN